MKHIQKDYKVKMYIPRESANQNVAIVGKGNDEDHTVPSVMKLIEKHIEKFKKEEVEEMIPEIHVDDTQCSEQIVDVPFLGSPTGSWKLSQHSTGANPRMSHRTDRQHVDTHTHKVVEKIVKDSQSPTASCERTGCEDCLKARPSSEPVNKS